MAYHIRVFNCTQSLFLFPTLICLAQIRWIEKLRQSQQVFQEKLKAKLYGIDAEHQTNKHSKLLLNKHKAALNQIADEDNCAGRDLYTSVPSRASSASPSSMHRTKATSAEIQEEPEEESTIKPCSTALPGVQIEPSQLNETKLSGCAPNALVPDNGVQNPSMSLIPSNKSEDTQLNPVSKDIQIRTADTCTDQTRKNLSIYDHTHLNVTDTAVAKQRFLEDHFRETSMAAVGHKKENTPVISSSVHNTSPPTLLKHLPETKVEFFYSPTGQSPFSPPLSPTLHPPCASLPSTVTLPDFYEYPGYRFHDELQQRMTRLQMNQENPK